MRVGVLIPSRDRPQLLREAIASVQETSSHADALVYIDEDQRELYGLVENSNVHVLHGPRVGPVASANALVKAFPGYDAYGLITDDSRITTPGWDGWLMDALDVFPKRLAVISPHHSHGNYVDMPFVSRAWVEYVGWYACPMAYHYVWPIITGLIGEMTAIVHAPKQSFHIEHNYDNHANAGLRGFDYEVFFQFVSAHLPGFVDMLREEMHR